MSLNPEQFDQLKKLWILKLVVESGNFQKAATLAKVTRSAISQTVSHLEKEYGKVLFIRERAGVKPSAYCLALLEKVQPVFASLLELEVYDKREIPRMSWLDIGAYESLAIQIMPRLLKRLEMECPGIRVTVKVNRSAKLATMVRKGELCMAIVIENDLNRGLTTIPLAQDRLGVFASPQVKQPDRLPLGSIAPGPDGVPTYYSKFIKSLNNKKVSFSSESMEALLAASAEGSIAAILPFRVAQRAKNELVEITPKDCRDKKLGTHWICLISQKNCDPSENAFLEAEIKALLNETT